MKGGIKRGFLLAKESPKTKTNNKNTKKHADLPHRMNEVGGGLDAPKSKLLEPPTQPRKFRATVSSNALLDVEEPSDYAHGDSGNDVCNRNRQTKLLHLVDADVDDTSTPIPIGSSDDGAQTPSLDNWIEPAATAPSQPSIVLPSANNINMQRASSAPDKSGKVLIDELKRPSIVQDANANTPDESLAKWQTIAINLDSTPDTSLSGIELETNLQSTSNATTNNESVSELPHHPNEPTIKPHNAPSQKPTLQFSNELSLLLAKLCRSMKPKKKQGSTTSSKDITVGVDLFTNKQSAALLKSFIAKHLSVDTFQTETLSSHVAELDMLWTVVLGQIAQDYIESIQSQKKAKKRKGSKTLSLSPELAVGLGVLEMQQLTGAVYTSLAKVFLDATEKSLNVHQNAESQPKQQKILALGATYLLRCRIRCIGITLSSTEQEKEMTYGQGLESIGSDVESLLSRVLPALVSIVCEDASECPTMLTSAAADSCFDLIEVTSRAVLLHHAIQQSTQSDTPSAPKTNFLSINVMRTWRDVMPLLEKLLIRKRCWISTSRKSNQSNGNKEDFSSNDNLRVNCTLSVVDDLCEVVKESKLQFFEHFMGDECWYEGSDLTAGLNLFWNLSGIRLPRANTEDDSSAIACFRVGGIAHSLCWQECLFGSGTHCSFRDYGGGAETSDLVPLLRKSATLMDSTRSAKMTGLEGANTNHQRMVVRAFVSWVCHGKKVFQIPPNDLLETAMESLLALLRSDSNECVDMSIAAL